MVTFLVSLLAVIGCLFLLWAVALFIGASKERTAHGNIVLSGFGSISIVFGGILWGLSRLILWIFPTDMAWSDYGWMTVGLICVLIALVSAGILWTVVDTFRQVPYGTPEREAVYKALSRWDRIKFRWGEVKRSSSSDAIGFWTIGAAIFLPVSVVLLIKLIF